MNFSKLSNQSLLGRMVRWPLRLIPASAHMPVLQGPLRGMRWIAGSSNHGCWLGSYEQDKAELFSSLLAPGAVVYDIGAHAGYYSLLSSVAVGPTGRVFAFEPLPQNLEHLRTHFEINRIENVTLIEAAVSDQGGTAEFQISEESSMGSLAVDAKPAGRTVTVELVSLDEMLAQGRLAPPTCIKMDVEGAEGRALAGALTCLREHRPSILLATHGEEVHRECLLLLREIGYTVRAVDGGDPAETDEVFAHFPES